MEWVNEETRIVGQHNNPTKLTKKSKVASFDLDHTIIKPSGNKKFSDTATDWEMYDGTVVDKLIKLHKLGYDIVIVSNQKGITDGKVVQSIWQKKIENIGKQLGIPFLIYASIKNDGYRKPRTGLYDTYIKCDPTKSFYCGDAGGLPKRKIKKHDLKKDFSDSDLKFALNAGLEFKHRDQFIFEPLDDFLNNTVNYIINYDVDFTKVNYGTYPEFVPNKSQELVINTGYPGSGKSYYTKKYINDKYDYVYVNRDTLKTPKKCMDKCREGLASGRCVIIDNTNPSVEDRKKYIDIATAIGITNIRSLHFTTPRDLAMHNNVYRNIITDGTCDIVPTIAHNIYRKKFEKPMTAEGFSKVEEVELVMELDNNDKLIYERYLL